MSAHAGLSHLVRQTEWAIRQQQESGFDTAFLPGGLDMVLTLPERQTEPVYADLADTLETLYQRHCDCTVCPLGHKRQHFVFGAGNEQADVLFIGEAPGADEDAQGRPFVGAAGQLFTRILKAIDFSRDEVYIANILKCRPPNNRDPKPDEMAACEPILREQIRLIQPILICALGRIAAQALLQTTMSISRLRGRFHDYHGIKLMVTYHPSALLRNPAYKRPTWEDVQLLRREYGKMIQTRADAS